MRIDKFISSTLNLTRNESRQEIKKGLVTINEKTVTKNDFIIDLSKDVIKYNGNTLQYQEFIYIMLNKPQGYLSANYDKNKKTVMDLLAEDIKKYKPSIVGRLDIDTEGLVLLTNDGKLLHKITAPKSDIYKKYYVEVEGIFTDDDIKKFHAGITINDSGEDYTTKPAILEIISTKEAYISVSEGKYHQIKKMCLATNKKVIYLKRIEIKGVVLDPTLESGKYRELNEEELNMLKSI